MRFALRIIRFVHSLPYGVEGQVLGRQLLKSATSVAANYRAACRSRSRGEFFSKLSIVVEESDETVFWLELIQESNLGKSPELVQEATELLYIFSSSRKTTRDNLKSPNH
jgi:four helix bundle protein